MEMAIPTTAASAPAIARVPSSRALIPDAPEEAGAGAGDPTSLAGMGGMDVRVSADVMEVLCVGAFSEPEEATKEPEAAEPWA